MCYERFFRKAVAKKDQTRDEDKPVVERAPESPQPVQPRQASKEPEKFEPDLETVS